MILIIKIKSAKMFNNLHNKLQISPSQNFDKIQKSDFERVVDRTLDQLPICISLNDTNYQLAAAILFEPPETVGIGHYTAAVKFNNSWEVFDDLRPTTFSLPSSTLVNVHSILYIITKDQ